MAEPFLSEIRIMSFGFPPQGWALCNGQLLPISQNQTLFNLIGTTYGGDGQSTFALPDLRGRLPLHHGNGSTLRWRNSHLRRQLRAAWLDVLRRPAPADLRERDAVQPDRHHLRRRWPVDLCAARPARPPPAAPGQRLHLGRDRRR